MSTIQTIAALWGLAVYGATSCIIPACVWRSQQSLVSRLVLGGLLSTAFWLAAAFCLATIHSFNAPILLLVWLLTLLLLRRYQAGVPLTRVTAASPEQLLAVLNRLRQWGHGQDGSFSLATAIRESRLVSRIAQGLSLMPTASYVALVGLGLVTAFVAVVQINALHGIRMDNSDGYVSLLRTRELLLNTHVAARPFVGPAIAASLSLVSGVDPLPLLRMLAILIPFLLAVALGRFVFLASRSLVAAAVTIYIAGAVPVIDVLTKLLSLPAVDLKSLLPYLASLPDKNLQWQILLLTFTLWMTILLDRPRVKATAEIATATGACVLVIVSAEPRLLLIVPLLGYLCLSRTPRWILGVLFTVVSLMLLILQTDAPIVASALPDLLTVSLAILLGLITFCLEYLLVQMAGVWARTIPAFGWLVLAVLWLPPEAATQHSLEYESIAENASLIAEQFPHERWIIAAPVEQLAEIYSLGAFEDLASLVEKAGINDLSKALKYGDNYDDLFIFVEKSPFNLFNSEPASVAFPVLVDSTYRNYRSPAGRASLESRALHLCESYRSTHRNVSIFFEDEHTRIYRIRLTLPKGSTT